ncbi:MAG: hypothetical protein IPK97_02085 [Ahniella sp.]|nr:hypothetical protein [Ahniella sp.]
MTMINKSCLVLGALVCAGVILHTTLRDAEASSINQPEARLHTELANEPNAAERSGPDTVGVALQSDLVASDAELVVPMQHRFLQGKYRITATNWQQLLATVSPEQARHLRAVNARYFGSLSFDNPQMLKTMVAQGFPTAEEWLQAKDMSDDALRIMAEGGNQKAQAFYLDRMVSNSAELASIREQNPDAYEKSNGPRMAMKASELAPKVQATNKSPFAGYLLGYVYSELSYPKSPESAAAGMFVAVERGDQRGVALMQRYQAKHPQMDVGVVMAAYASFR